MPDREPPLTSPPMNMRPTNTRAMAAMMTIVCLRKKSNMEYDVEYACVTGPGLTAVWTARTFYTFSYG